ncbi:MAG: branched-chain-amino-acid transaminase [Candidatus Thiodiazotropha lotti]|uniref:Branched-chain-amino-acid aminotransferase n=1 Tax=Candidatus Thiodiazotropha endoloripes TaxID=1818881 RepID=A0A1E2UTF7_9GAMM|nr:branched-chain-amino-acid transaminase [Candidatus Thiodiazotropha endoloripes]MCG7899465.1 branched-chain-amino-acid transaminase [Candidatus Thiodiazotropha weberae]MCG7990728.1 branched-chain-amino-acid transaminase [Candidatus Thiodiazotropha lotti]MCG7999407.1 branched-chain-amino-acid transaminase [Candidatus Thiodiazotropha lotti]MCW4182382.1 branched-chain-amino-acid transaminase [Candidatus Thiodiazotropha weberae]MCW4191175.1 branched-chain-amino-acid transaminase [Candidatus Thio
MSESPQCWINGELVTQNEAKVSVFDHGFLYGDGVFEGIRFFNKHPFMLYEHLIRLQKSAKAIALEVPYDNQAILNAIEQVIHNFAEDSGYLRLIVTRGVGPLGLDPTGCSEPSLFIMADQLAIVSERIRTAGVRLIIASTRRLPNDGLDSRIKNLNYLNQILARMEANEAGADEAVLLNQAGRVAEGTTENIFIVVEGKLLTPPVTEGALDGITRNLVIQLAQQNGISVAESPLTSYDLYNADECFLTGTGAELIPVCKIDGRRVNACPGAVYKQLEEYYRKTIVCQSENTQRFL